MLQIVGISVLALLYAGAAARVRRRRGILDFRRTTAFALGAALLLAAVLMPDDTFSLHMAQHLLLGDLAPLFVVLGLNGPLLRPALALAPVRALRVLAHPFVALPLWAVDLCVWHLPRFFDAALRHSPVHAAQHLCFFVAGALLWSALLELLPGPRWFRLPQKLAYLGVMWLVSLSLSQVFIWSSHPYYAYRRVGDQRAGGGIMLLEGSIVMVSVLAWLLWRELLMPEETDVVPLAL